MIRSLSISIPAYNEEATIRALVLQSLDVLAARFKDYEVVIINDGSRDRTGALADALAREHSQVRVLHHAKNLGFGVTLREVFTEPTKEAIFFIPGDGQIAPSELDRLLPEAEHSDLVLGRRNQRCDSLFRRLLSGGYNLLISMLLGRRVHDVDSVALVRREVVQAISLSSCSAFLHAELLLRTVRGGFRWSEVPILHQARTSDESKVLKASVLVPTLKDLLRYVVSDKKTAGQKESL